VGGVARQGHAGGWVSEKAGEEGAGEGDDGTKGERVRTAWAGGRQGIALAMGAIMVRDVRFRGLVVRVSG